MPDVQVSRRALVLAALALALALGLANRLLRSAGTAYEGSQAAGAAQTRAAAPAAPLLVVHVAGGVTRKAEVALVNLAAPLADGTQIVVPARAPPARGGAGSGAETAPTAPVGPLHLNTATLEELDALAGVGPVTAQKILDYRAEHGAFASVDELDAIPGIGPKRLADLRDLVA